MKIEVFKSEREEPVLRLALKQHRLGVVLCAVDSLGVTVNGGSLLVISEQEGVILLQDLRGSLGLP